MLLQAKEPSNRRGALLTVQSPRHKELGFGPTKDGSNGFTSPKSRINGLLLNKLQVIQKHILQVASQHPSQTHIITQRLRELQSLLNRVSQRQGQQTTSCGIQTDEPYLPPFCQEISGIYDRPKQQANEKCTPQYLKAREAIYQEIYADNQNLVRENLQISEENWELSETVASLTHKYNQTTRKYEELQKTIEMLHEVGSVYNSKVLPEGGYDKEDLLTDAGKFVFSPRSSNLSCRKSCLSVKNTDAPNNFDRFSSRKVNFCQLPSSPKALLHEQHGVQTQMEAFTLDRNDFSQELALYQRTLAALTTQNAQQQLILSKISDIITNYLGTNSGTLTLDNVTELLEKVYKKRNLNLIRRKTMSIEEIEESSMQLCSSQKQMTVIEKSYRKICRRRA